MGDTQQLQFLFTARTHTRVDALRLSDSELPILRRYTPWRKKSIQGLDVGRTGVYNGSSMSLKRKTKL
jgi:hypothetical protein